jgi:hypothetical protein
MAPHKYLDSSYLKDERCLDLMAILPTQVRYQ